jgi:indolepyruvate ferredoxin oxidoreductase beta subunit
MRFDILFAGVGGQGVLSMAAIIGRAADERGLNAKQSEVHGMAQRGGAVQAHLRLSDGVIESDLIPRGGADLILSLEPLESLRYLDLLSPAGTLVTSSTPFINIPDYPDPDDVLRRVRALPRALIVDAERLAEDAGDVQAANTVLVGAASRLLPLPAETLERAVDRTFRRKGELALRVNLAAFRAGRAVAHEPADLAGFA